MYWLTCNDENFDVEKLAKEAGMSRVPFTAELKSVKNQDVSQFIREIRLKRAMEMLQNNEGNAAEIAYRVGFGSPAYFSKCFHNYYGYTPGDVKRRVTGSNDLPQTDLLSDTSADRKEKPGTTRSYFSKNVGLRKILITSMGIMTGLVLIWFFYILVLKSPKDQVGSGLQDPVKSIAVPPFKNLSDDLENQYFTDGVREDVINQLYQIRKLRVIPVTTSDQLWESAMLAPIRANKLKINYVLEASIQKDYNKIRVNVKLRDVRLNQYIWIERYDKELTDIFNIQSDIAIQIANELYAVLTPEEIEHIEKIPTKNPEAYNLYLYGRYFWYTRTEEGLIKSIEYFEKALALDPDYALAWAGLADAYFIQAWWGWYPSLEGWAKAKESALRAIDIDNNLAEAHTTLGEILCNIDWKWEEAEKEFLLAIELNPNYLPAHQYYSELLDILRQNDKAREQINLALELDPFFFMLHLSSSTYYYNEGKLNESLDEYRKAHELAPNFPYSWRSFHIYVRQHEDLKAIEELKKILLLDTLTAKNANTAKDVYSKSGMNVIFDWLIELQLKKPEPNPLMIAGWYANQNKKDAALNWLENAFEKRLSRIPRINNNPDFENLRLEPRFQALIKKMGLSEYQKLK